MHSLQAVGIRTARRILGRRHSHIVRTAAGLEFSERTTAGNLLTRENDMTWLIGEAARHGLRLQSRTAGQFTELYAVAPWAPIRRADADSTIALLSRLFAEHGPPLVLKSDNGKALTQGGVPALLQAHGVTPLMSPVYRPQYNGSCEAGVHAMKVRTEDLALLVERRSRL